MINKLLLVRVKFSRADLVDSAGVKSFAGEPLNISPLAWNDEAGLSHYGWELKDLKLKDFQALEKWAGATEGVSVIEHTGDVTESLAAVGLRINKSAE